MRNLVILILAAFLVFGCMGGGAPSGSTGQTGGLPQIPGTTCEPAYTFSDLPEGVLSQSADLGVAVTCGAGKKLAVKLDGIEAGSLSPNSNDAQQLSLSFAPKKDGAVKLTVESDGKQVYSLDWTVKPLGSQDTKGSDSDGVSFKEWRAVAVDVGNPINAGSAKIFTKRLEFRSQPGTDIIVELRKDKSGKPGDAVASVERPINVTTLSENWISFDFAQKPALSPGRYWIVMKIKQTENVRIVSDTIYIHNVAIDKQSSGNDYTRQMFLNVNSVDGTATESSWDPLPYDKAYSVVLTSG